MGQEHILQWTAGLNFPTRGNPLFLFGLPSNENDKLATLIIQHGHWRQDCRSPRLWFQDLTKIGPANVAHLNNGGDESICPLDAIPEFRRKPERLYGSPDASPVASS